MRSLLYLFTASSVLTLAVWAYAENYRTKAAIDELGAMRAEIASLGEQAAVLRAEWAYLNRPERLRHLADMNYDRLELMPLEARRFRRAEAVPLAIGPIALARADGP